MSNPAAGCALRELLVAGSEGAGSAPSGLPEVDGVGEGQCRVRKVGEYHRRRPGNKMGTNPSDTGSARYASHRRFCWEDIFPSQ